MVKQFLVHIFKNFNAKKMCSGGNSTKNFQNKSLTRKRTLLGRSTNVVHKNVSIPFNRVIHESLSLEVYFIIYESHDQAHDRVSLELLMIRRFIRYFTLILGHFGGSHKTFFFFFFLKTAQCSLNFFYESFLTNYFSFYE